jgi:hypothetical protein
MVDVPEAEELNAVLDESAGSSQSPLEVSGDDLLAGDSPGLSSVVGRVLRAIDLSSLPTRLLADLPLRGLRRIRGGL